VICFGVAEYLNVLGIILGLNELLYMLNNRNTPMLMDLLFVGEMIFEQLFLNNFCDNSLSYFHCIL